MTNNAAIKKFLIIDDDPEFRILIKTLLADYFQDAEFIEYNPVTEGIPGDNFNWGQFDVLILDQYLCVHGLNGLDLFLNNHSKPDFPATIMLTAAGNEDLVIHAYDSGIKAYIRKEKFDIATLATAVSNIFDDLDANQEMQNQLHEAKNQLDIERAKTTEKIAELENQLQNLQEEKRKQQEAAEEIQRMKNEAEEQIQIDRAKLATETDALKSQLQFMEDEKLKQQDTVKEIQSIKDETEVRFEKERAELVEKNAELTAQVQRMGDERKLQQDAMADSQKVTATAEEKLKNEQAEHNKIIAELNSKLQGMEEVQRKNCEAETQFQKEREEMAKAATVTKAQLHKTVAEDEKIRKQLKVLLQDKSSFADARHQHEEELAAIKNELANITQQLTAAEAKLTTSEQEKQKIISDYKQQLKKVPAVEIVEEIVDFVLEDDPEEDPDEPLDLSHQLPKEEKVTQDNRNLNTDKVETASATPEDSYESELLDEIIDPDELLDPTQIGRENDKHHTTKQQPSGAQKIVSTFDEPIDLNLFDESIDPDELLDPSQATKNKNNRQDEDK